MQCPKLSCKITWEASFLCGIDRGAFAKFKGSLLAQYSGSIGWLQTYSLETFQRLPCVFAIYFVETTRRPASTGIMSTRLQETWSILVKSWKWNYRFKFSFFFSFQRFFTNINCTIDLHTLCKRRGGYHDFLLNFFLSHSTETFSKGNFRRFRKFRESKKFMHKKGKRGKNLDFLSKHYSLTVPKSFIGEPFCVSEKFCYQKILSYEKGEERREWVSFFPSKICCLTLSKTFIGNTPVFQKFSGLEKFCQRRVEREGGSECHFFPSIICCLTAPKKIVGETFGFSRKTMVSETFLDNGGGGGSREEVSITIFRRKNNVSHCRRNS